MGQSDNVWSHFNELALVILLLALVSLDVHMIHHGTDTESITWLQGIVGQVLASLLTLMVKSTSASSTTTAPNGSVSTSTTEVKK